MAGWSHCCSPSRRAQWTQGCASQQMRRSGAACSCTRGKQPGPSSRFRHGRSDALSRKRQCEARERARTHARAAGGVHRGGEGGHGERTSGTPQGTPLNHRRTRHPPQPQRRQQPAVQPHRVEERRGGGGGQQRGGAPHLCCPTRCRAWRAIRFKSAASGSMFAAVAWASLCVLELPPGSSRTREAEELAATVLLPGTTAAEGAAAAASLGLPGMPTAVAAWEAEEGAQVSASSATGGSARRPLAPP